MSSTTQPSPGAGYRWVRAGEWLHNGDESRSALISNWWVEIPQHAVGYSCDFAHTVRRRTTARKAAKGRTKK